MFHCSSLKSSYPRLLPRSPKDSSTHLCLFFSLAYRVIIAIFLNSIYMCLCTVLGFFFLKSFTQYNRLQVHPPHSNWFKRILCNGWVTFHWVYVHQLSYPLVSWWTSRLLPYPGNYSQSCDEHWGTCDSFNSGVLGVHAQQWDSWVMKVFFVQFFCVILPRLINIFCFFYCYCY